MFKFIFITAFPVVFLLCYLYKQDQVKPEPKKKLAECFGLGMLGGVIGMLVNRVFAWIGWGTGYGSLFFGDVICGFVKSAVFVSVVYFILWKHSKKNAYFDEFFDGPVYAVCIAFGYEVLGKFFGMFSDEWVYVAFWSIIAVVAVYATAMTIGYYYSLAFFGKLELTKTNKLKMWAYPVAILWVYNSICYWSNTRIIGFLVAFVLFAALGYFIYKKNNAIIAALKEQDRIQEEQKQPNHE